MTIKEVVDTNYANVFLNFEGEERTAQIKAVQYIQNLGNSVSADVSGWDLFEIFGSGNGKIYQAKTAINQRFFAYVDKLPKKENSLSPAVAVLSPRIMANLSSILQSHRSSALATANRGIEDSSRRASERYQRFEESLSALGHFQRQKDALSGGAMPDLPRQIDTINKAGFWYLDTFDEINSTLFFRTTRDVRLHHVNTAAGLDLHVNFGRFATVLELKKLHLSVIGDGCNISQGGHIHPHIGSQGGVCWGNAHDMVTRALPMLELAPVMEALSVILTHYNEDSPYVTIERFHKEQSKALFEEKEICQTCGEEENKCRCAECRVCGDWYDTVNGPECQCCYECERENCVCDIEEEESPAPIAEIAF